MLFEDEGLTGWFSGGWDGREPLIFRRCDAVGVSIGPVRSDPNRRARPSIVNVQVQDCRGALRVHDSDLRDVTVDGFRNPRPLSFYGNTYERVTLRGHINSFMIVNGPGPFQPRGPEHDENDARQKAVDWALDISEVEASDLEIRGIPSRLIRRDPERQGLVTRAVARSGAWRAVDLSDSYFDYVLRELASSDEEDALLLPPARGKFSMGCRDALQRLRDAGLAT